MSGDKEISFWNPGTNPEVQETVLLDTLNNLALIEKTIHKIYTIYLPENTFWNDLMF